MPVPDVDLQALEGPDAAWNLGHSVAAWQQSCSCQKTGGGRCTGTHSWWFGNNDPQLTFIFFGGGFGTVMARNTSYKYLENPIYRNVFYPIYNQL